MVEPGQWDARITIDFPIAFYTDKTGELGTVYDVTFYERNLYMQ